MNHDFDFSRINIDYLLRAHDIAKQDTETAAIMLGISPAITQLLAKTSPAELEQLLQLRISLLTSRQTPQWWERLFLAMNKNELAEIEYLLERASLS